MAGSPIERLDRRYRQLERQDDGVDFVRQIRTYLDALDAERQARRIVKRLHRAAEEAVERFNDTVQELIAEAVDIRRRLAQAAPDVDNSDATEPERTSYDYRDWELDSFASFDRLAQADVRIEFAPLPYYDTGDRTSIGTMVVILRGRLRQAQYGDQGGLLSEQENLRPELDDFRREINNLNEKHRHALAEFKEQALMLPGLAERRLRGFSDALRHEPFIIEEDADEEQIAERALFRGFEHLSATGIVRRALAGDVLDEGERRAFDRVDGFLRGEADRLHEEIVARLGAGEGQSSVERALRSVGRGSLKVGLFIVSTVLAVIIGLIVTAYVAKWLPGQSGTNPTPTTNTVPKP